MTFFSVEHTFIICCGNKCSFIDYKIKVSSLGIFLCECVCLSIGWLFGCCERWLLFGQSDDGDSLFRFDTLSHARIFLFVFFFFRVFFLSCIFFNSNLAMIRKARLKAFEQNSLAATAHRMLCLRSLYLVHPLMWDVFRAYHCVCVCMQVLGLQPLPTAVSKQ